MHGYIEFGDEARAAWEEREHRTRRLYSGIRGAICAMDKPCGERVSFVSELDYLTTLRWIQMLWRRPMLKRVISRNDPP